MKSFVTLFKVNIEVNAVIKSEGGVVEVSRGGHLGAVELAAGCVEHGLRVCRSQLSQGAVELALAAMKNLTKKHGGNSYLPHGILLAKYFIGNL